MAKKKINRLYEEENTKQKRLKRRQYNKTYYENTKKQRQEHYQQVKLTSGSTTSCKIKKLEKTDPLLATAKSYSDNYGESSYISMEYKNDDTICDEEHYSIEYNEQHHLPNMVDFEEAAGSANDCDQSVLDDVFRVLDDTESSALYYDSDNSSASEFSHCFYDEKNSDNIFYDDLTIPQFKSSFSISSKEYSKTDIATCLCLLKKRHKCSNALLEDIISLLHIIVIDAEKNIPKSLFEIRKLLKIYENKKNSKSSMPSSTSTTITICQSCEQITESVDNCSNKECSEHVGFKLNPYTYTYFNIRRQLEQILQREIKIDFQTPSSSSSPSILTDIKDGQIYQNFLSKINISDCYHITFTFSTDDVQIGTSTAKSLWVTTLTINEVKQSECFLLHNVIIGGINSCFKKPTRRIMQIMIDRIVKELKDLQNPKGCYIKALNNKFELYSAHLLGSVNDKPATALIQNTPEPTDAYGCSKCEVKGKTTFSNPQISEKKLRTSVTSSNRKKTCKETHRIRVFVLETDQQIPKARSTERYQTIMKMVQSKTFTSVTEEEQQDLQRGYLGPCLLTNLTFFDQGQSFLSDSLHTLYGGAMKKLLSLWFDRKWCTKEKPWTIESRIPEISKLLKSFHSPSTTVRVPRDLKLHKKYKGSEYRSLLLIFYPIFQNSLPQDYYDHVKLLAFAAHIGEGYEIEKKDIETMRLLLNEHVRNFHGLYGERHCVNNIHSLVHFAGSVLDYGPLQCYSTFNYESILGAVTSTIHGCRKQDQEIFNNMEMLRQASYVALEKSKDSKLYEYMLKIMQTEDRKPYVPGEFRTTKPFQLKENQRNYFQKLYSTDKIQAFYRCKYENKQYNSYNWKKSNFDTAILFRKKEICKLKFGIIDKFFVSERVQKRLLIHVYELEDEYSDFVSVNNIIVENSNTAIGKINFDVSIQIDYSQIVEKVFFLQQDETFFFIRLPNKTESS